MNTRRYALPLSVCIAMLIMGIGGCDKKQGDEASGGPNATATKNKAPIRLGAIFPLSGDGASYGKRAMNGIQLATEEVNEQGGILGRKVSVDFQDDRNESKEAVAIVTRFCTIDNLPVIFGSAGSTVSLAVAPIANRHHVVLVSPISSSTELSTKGGAYFFRTCPADDLQADVLAGWVHASGAKRVALVYTNNSWGKPLADKFTRTFAAAGGEVVLSEGAAEGTTDFRTIAAKLKSVGNLDAIVSPTYPKEGGIFVRQVRELGLTTTLYGGDNWGSPEFRSTAGDAAEGVFYTAPSETITPEYTDFATRYESRFSEQPDVLAAYAYDAARAVFKAIAANDSSAGDQIRKALAGVSFAGASGHIAFTSNGDLESEAFARFTIKNGQPQSVSGSGE